MVGIRKFSIAMALVGGLAGGIGIGGLVQAETLTVGAAHSLKAPFHVQAETLTVGAAHSLKAPFHEILPLFEKEYGATVRVVYGPSQTLRRQIEKGEPIDVFLSEGVEEVQKLQEKGLTLNGGPRIYAQTSLVLIMATASPLISTSLRDVPPRGASRMALGDPRTSSLGEITA